MAFLKQWVFDGQVKKKDEQRKEKQTKRNSPESLSLLKFTQSFPFTGLDPGGQ